MTLSNLSKLARHRGDQAAAIDYGEQVVAIIEDGSPEDYSTLVPAKNNLALAYAAAGRYEESISTMQALIEQRSMIDGPEGSGELGINYKNYATILHTAGRFGEAREAVLTAREYMERHLPGNSPFQATHHFTEALITLDSGDAAAAEAPLLRTLDILEPSLGAEHYQVHVTRCILAEVKRQIGDPLSAQRLAEAALAGMKASGSKTSNYQERCEDTLERLNGAAVANSSAPTSR
jgi:tetratricopeptide (TPR) repeat protein